jgi:hypothetical protein
MKKIFMSLVLLSSLLFAQTTAIDTSANVAQQDSSQINKMVRQQIENAKIKASAPGTSNNLNEKIKVPENNTAQIIQENNLILLIMNQPVHIKIFLVFVVVVLLTIIMRRTILAMSRRTKQVFKAKIAMIREEKVFIEENPYLKSTREQLKGNKIIFNANEKQISKTAKEMNLAKGELLLAARLNLFEVGQS